MATLLNTTGVRKMRKTKYIFLDNVYLPKTLKRVLVIIFKPASLRKSNLKRYFNHNTMATFCSFKNAAITRYEGHICTLCVLFFIQFIV